MVQIDLVSDLHLDVYWSEEQSLEFINSLRANADILVIAGDLCEHFNLTNEYIEAFSEKWKHIVYVPGNHEYWGTSLDEKIEVGDWYVLRNEVLYVGGIRIAGSTGWFPEAPDNIFYEHYMNDFARIIDFKPSVYEEHAKAREFFSTTSADVFVSHHLPFAESIAPQYRRAHETNRFFYSEFESAIEANPVKPKFWLHGHTHAPRTYEHDGIQVVCNPRGYAGEDTSEYQPITLAV